MVAGQVVGGVDDVRDTVTNRPMATSNRSDCLFFVGLLPYPTAILAVLEGLREIESAHRFLELTA